MQASEGIAVGSLSILDDHELLNIVTGRLSGFQEAAELLSSRLSGFLVAMACRIAPLQPDDLSDVLQETWQRAFQCTSDSFQTAPEFRAWLKKVVHSRVLDMVRRPRAQAIPEHHEPEAEELVAHADNPSADALKLCLEELDRARPDFASVVRGILAGKSGQQLGQELQISPGTVYSRFDRSKTLLKECVERRLA
ncbi:MAG: RNA polymerase sigma factor [Planctomycetota bacterium]